MSSNNFPFSTASGSSTGTQDVQMSSRGSQQPPPRKQNTACDACRARKVKCNRLPGEEKCQVGSSRFNNHPRAKSPSYQHCTTKNYPCTHHVQQATVDKKRGQSNGRSRPRTLNAPRYIPPPEPVREIHQSSSPPITSPSTTRTTYNNGGSSPPTDENGSTSPQGTIPLPLPPHIKYRHGFYPAFSSETPTLQVLDYLFSPPDGEGEGDSYTDWGDRAEDLRDSSFRVVFALDMVEVFFQIVHSRSPFLQPDDFRRRLNLQLDPATAESVHPVNPALLATIIAWGTKFSQHPTVMAAKGGKSGLSTVIVERARELAEAMKVHRKATMDNICIALLMEPLQPQDPRDVSGFHGFWLSSALSHIFHLRLNHGSNLRLIPDNEQRGRMIFAWWFSLLADAYHSVYYRRKPRIAEEDHDIDFYVDPVVIQDPNSDSARVQLQTIGYFEAAHTLARISRYISRNLWIPATETRGIPLPVMHTIMSQLELWQVDYLHRSGAMDIKPEWGFIAAISACANDSTYHLHWIILFNALDDFGMLEERGTPTEKAHHMAEIHAVKVRVYEQAMKGASRIATLAGLLADNEYLKLDPAVMHVSCIQAGTLLARLGNAECANCISGLKQYSFAYEEAGHQAEQMQQTFISARAGVNRFKHMRSHVHIGSPRRQSESLTDALTPMITN